MTSMAALSLQNFKLLFFVIFFKNSVFLFFIIKMSQQSSTWCRISNIFFAQNELKLKLKKVWFFLVYETGNQKRKSEELDLFVYCLKLFFVAFLFSFSSSKFLKILQQIEIDLFPLPTPSKQGRDEWGVGGGRGVGGSKNCCVTSLLNDIWRQHFGEFVVLQTSPEELLFRQVAVPVLVHPREDVLRPLLRGVRRLRRAGSQHVVDGLQSM